jgi:hypothetical protein
MHRGWWALALALAAAAAGCLTKNAGPSKARSIGPPVPPDGLYVHAVLIERPVGDPLLDRDLWAAGLPAVLADETRVLLAENGVRAAVLGGNLPRKFTTLLGSEAEAVNPRMLTFANRPDAVVPTAGPTDPCEFDVLPGLAAKRTRLALRQANGGILVRPEALPDGRVKLWCEPQVQHGDEEPRVRPTADGTGIVMIGEVPLETFPALGFATVLGPNDYLVLGWRSDQPGTLGSALFEADANGRPRQRVLVLRAGKAGDPGPGDLPAVPRPNGRPSIAAEAGRVTK